MTKEYLKPLKLDEADVAFLVESSWVLIGMIAQLHTTGTPLTDGDYDEFAELKTKLDEITEKSSLKLSVVKPDA